MRARSPLFLVAIGAAALALVGVSYASAHIDLGGWAMPVALGIAAVKAGLILWFFMELGEMRTSIQVAALVSFLLFVLLVGLATLDVATRSAPPLLPADDAAVH